MKKTISTCLEWSGVISAIAYSALIASNLGYEYWGFVLLITSAFCLGLWAYLKRYKGILILQLFYAAVAIIGMIRWN